MALTTKQIADLNALNQRISSGYKPNTTDLANLEYAKKQGYVYNPLPQNAIKIQSLAELSGLKETDIYRIGQDIYKLPKVDTTIDISNQNIPNIPPANNVNYDKILVNSLKDVNQGLVNILNEQQQKLKSEDKSTELQKRLEQALNEQENVYSNIFEENKKTYKLDENFDKLQNLMPQIAKIQADYNRLAEENLNRPISSRIIGGTADMLQRQKAIELAGLSAVAQVYQGNIDLARNIINDAINAKYKDIINYNDNLKTQLFLLIDFNI